MQVAVIERNHTSANHIGWCKFLLVWRLVQKLALILALTLDVINGVLNLHQSQIKTNVQTGHPPLISILQSGPQASCIIEIWSGRMAIIEDCHASESTECIAWSFYFIWLVSHFQKFWEILHKHCVAIGADSLGYFWLVCQVSPLNTVQQEAVEERLCMSRFPM